MIKYFFSAAVFASGALTGYWAAPTGVISLSEDAVVSGVVTKDVTFYMRGNRAVLKDSAVTLSRGLKNGVALYAFEDFHEMEIRNVDFIAEAPFGGVAAIKTGVK